MRFIDDLVLFPVTCFFVLKLLLVPKLLAGLFCTAVDPIVTCESSHESLLA